MKKIVGLSPCPRHASGNVGDLLAVETAQEIIENICGPIEFETFFKREDLTSRLDRINDADAIVLFKFEILQEDTRPENYRIAEDLEDVRPPIIPDSSSYSFHPGDQHELGRQTLGRRTQDFLDHLRANCPEGRFPVRDNWVGQVLEQNGYETILTGDPGWYELKMLGEGFHQPATIDQLVLTPPRSPLYLDQARSLVTRLSSKFPDARRVVSLHTAPTDVDRKLCKKAQTESWEVHYASHDTSKIDFYRDSDLHVGYRLHGHLAHLRLRRPSLVLAEDSRAMGLTRTLGTAGIAAYSPRNMSGANSVLRKASYTTPVIGLHLLLNKTGYTDIIPRDSPLKATQDSAAVDKAFNFIERQFSDRWSAYEQVQEMFDQTYEKAVEPYWRAALNLE